jgi:hypothetical protein
MTAFELLRYLGIWMCVGVFAMAVCIPCPRPITTLKEYRKRYYGE